MFRKSTMSNPMLNHIYNYRLLQIVDFIYETTLFIGPLNLRWILILFFSSSSKLLPSDHWWRWPDFKYKGTKSCSVFFGTLKLKQLHACYRRLTYFMCVSHFEKQVLITFFPWFKFRPKQYGPLFSYCPDYVSFSLSAASSF